MSRQRVMARPIKPDGRSRTKAFGSAVAVLALMVVGALIVSNFLGPGATASPSGTAVAALPSPIVGGGDPATTTPTEAVTPRPARTPATGRGTPQPAVETPSPDGSPKSKPTPLPRRTPDPTPTADPDRAPTSADGFDLEGQLIEIGFPLRQQTKYHYRNNFRDAREGIPDSYNHERLHKDGSAVRAHDGTDVYANQGEPLIAVFSGTVVDPRSRWRPWEADRYGKTVALVSDDPRTEGYTALYVHASQVWVSPGDHVERGQVLGTVGRTGNADGTNVPSHLHFELRAPFLIDWTPLGEDRRLDAFNPFPSLVAADPKR